MKKTLLVLAALQLLSLGQEVLAGITTGYVPPLGKQGVGESYYFGPPDARYGRFAQLGLNSRTYNFLWRTFESAGIPSKAAPPMNCPAGHVQVPANESERIAKGYKRYRCLDWNVVQAWDATLAKDAQPNYQFQSAAVLWAAPEHYRYPGCQGVDFGQGVVRDGCVPRDDAMDDWEDFVNFLASRYSTNGTAGMGRIKQFVVWNEVASANWFDYSPIVPVSTPSISELHINAWVGKYLAMMERANAALARHTQGVLLEVSLDTQWERPAFYSRQHLGSKTVLDKLWELQTVPRFDWSIAIHAYGDPINETPQLINFQGIAKVSAYQLDKLRSLGVSSPASAPQMKVVAAEQGWQKALGMNIQARNICEAHEISSRHPFLVTQYHSVFQDPDPNSDANPQSWGLIPYSAGWDLAGASGAATYQAYASTGYNGWQKNNNHFCCTEYKLGCQTPSPHSMTVAYASSALLPDSNLWSKDHLIDGNPNTSYSSAYSATAANTNNYQVAAWIPSDKPEGVLTATVRLRARTFNNQVLGFPAEYMIYLSDPQSGWVLMGTYKNQPDSQGNVVVVLPRIVRATGVLMYPVTLGADGSGNHFFQLNEISLHPGGSNGAYLPIPMVNLDSSRPALSTLVDGNTNTFYESSPATSPNNSAGEFVAAWSSLATGSLSASGIRLKASVAGGVATSFPVRYMVSITNATNSGWDYLGEFSSQPDSNGNVVIAFDTPRATNGVLVHPSVLPPTAAGNYRFRIAELELLP